MDVKILWRVENQHGGTNAWRSYNDKIGENKLLSYFLHVVGLKTKVQDSGNGNHNLSYYTTQALQGYLYSICCPTFSGGKFAAISCI